MKESNKREIKDICYNAEGSFGVEKCLVISTAHMPDEDPSFGDVRTVKDQYGIIAFFPWHDGPERYEIFSKNKKKIRLR